jgi:2-polyprenyl-3-methyl-5-hydroxy-6-metoxy-1,4-benzoquinol methylase
MMGSMKASCWCGARETAPFSSHYQRCLSCGTLYLIEMPTAEDLQVTPDDGGLYGQEYWLSHQEDSYDQPNIHERARLDLGERCAYWLQTLLKYKLPPGRALEIGSAHGGLVALMKGVGFEATGLEMSRWVVDFARGTFDIPMLHGRLEDQALPARSLDVIALMDVLEHLRDPLETLRRCVGLLAPGGVLLVQTPRYPDGGKTAEELSREGDAFVSAQLKEREHLFLFTTDSVRVLLERAGCPHVEFIPALFPYDMFFVAGPQPIRPVPAGAADDLLARSPSTRLLQAVLDAAARGREIEDDRRRRIAMVESLNRHVEEQAAGYEARGRVIAEQAATIDGLAADVARLNTHIAAAAEDYGTHIAALTADYDARGRVIAEQQATIEQLAGDVARLNAHIEASGADYEARGRVIAEQLENVERLASLMAEQNAQLEEAAARIHRIRQARVVRALLRLRLLDLR